MEEELCKWGRSQYSPLTLTRQDFQQDTENGHTEELYKWRRSHYSLLYSKSKKHLQWSQKKDVSDKLACLEVSCP